MEKTNEENKKNKFTEIRKFYFKYIYIIVLISKKIKIFKTCCQKIKK